MTFSRSLTVLLAFTFSMVPALGGDGVLLYLLKPSGESQMRSTWGGLRGPGPESKMVPSSQQAALSENVGRLMARQEIAPEDRQLTESFVAHLALVSDNNGWRVWSLGSPTSLYQEVIPSLTPVGDAVASGASLAIGIGALLFALDQSIDGLVASTGMTLMPVGETLIAVPTGVFASAMHFELADAAIALSQAALEKEKDWIRLNEGAIGPSDITVTPASFKKDVLLRFVELLRVRMAIEQTSFADTFKSLLLQQVDLKIAHSFMTMSRDLENLGAHSARGLWGKVQMHSALAVLLRDAVRDPEAVDRALAALKSYLDRTEHTWSDDQFVVKARSTHRIITETWGAFKKAPDRENARMTVTNAAYGGTEFGKNVGCLTIDLLAGTAGIIASATLSSKEAEWSKSIINGIALTTKLPLNALDSLPVLVSVVEGAIKGRGELTDFALGSVSNLAFTVNSLVERCAAKLPRFTSWFRRKAGG